MTGQLDVERLRGLAEQGDAEAQFKLGFAYHMGRGVPEDYVEAYKWFDLAAGAGSELSVKCRAELESHMTATDISEAQRLAAEWREKHSCPGNLERTQAAHGMTQPE